MSKYLLLLAALLAGCHIETDAERNTRIITEMKRCEEAGLPGAVYFSYHYTVTCYPKDQRPEWERKQP